MRDALEALLSIFIIDATRDLDPTLAVYDNHNRDSADPRSLVLKSIIAKNQIDLLVVDSLADVFGEEIKRHAARSFIGLSEGFRLYGYTDCAPIS